jgi:hypothetical protein
MGIPLFGYVDDSIVDDKACFAAGFPNAKRQLVEMIMGLLVACRRECLTGVGQLVREAGYWQLAIRFDLSGRWVGRWKLASKTPVQSCQAPVDHSFVAAPCSSRHTNSPSQIQSTTYISISRFEKNLVFAPGICRLFLRNLYPWIRNIKSATAPAVATLFPAQSHP